MEECIIHGHLYQSEFSRETELIGDIDINISFKEWLMQWLWRLASRKSVGQANTQKLPAGVDTATWRQKFFFPRKPQIALYGLQRIHEAHP